MIALSITFKDQTKQFESNLVCVEVNEKELLYSHSYQMKPKVILVELIESFKTFSTARV